MTTAPTRRRHQSVRERRQAETRRIHAAYQATCGHTPRKGAMSTIFNLLDHWSKAGWRRPHARAWLAISTTITGSGRLIIAPACDDWIRGYRPDVDRRGRDTVSYAAAWLETADSDRTLAVLAAAAGLSFDELTTLRATGDIDLDGLRLMAGLRGLEVPR